MGKEAGWVGGWGVYIWGRGRIWAADGGGLGGFCGG